MGTMPPVNWYELDLAWRYTRAQRRKGFVSFIAMMSMIGIALGVAALIVVLSVMNGFGRELRSRILAATPHVMVRGAEQPIGNWQGLAADLSKNSEVQAVAPFVEGNALFANGPQTQPGLLRALVPSEEAKVTDVARHMRQGSLNDLKAGEFGIVLGRDLALMLGVRLGDRVAVTVQGNLSTPLGTPPRIKQFRLVGLFEVGYEQVDSRVALVHLEDAQRLLQLDTQVTGLQVKLNDLMQAPRVARDFLRDLPAGLGVADWTRQHANLFRAVEIEKRVMFIILTLIVAVAAFNLVSTLVMVVNDKRADIAILRTLGGRPRSILAIFMAQGVMIGVAGTLLGAVLGVLLAANVDVVVPFIERTFGVAFMDKSVYQIPDLPSELRVEDVTKIVLTALVLSLIATIYPAWNASRVNPAEALRHE